MQTLTNLQQYALDKFRGIIEKAGGDLKMFEALLSDLQDSEVTEFWAMKDMYQASQEELKLLRSRIGDQTEIDVLKAENAMLKATSSAAVGADSNQEQSILDVPVFKALNEQFNYLLDNVRNCLTIMGQPFAHNLDSHDVISVLEVKAAGYADRKETAERAIQEATRLETLVKDYEKRNDEKDAQIRELKGEIAALKSENKELASCLEKEKNLHLQTSKQLAELREATSTSESGGSKSPKWFEVTQPWEYPFHPDLARQVISIIAGGATQSQALDGIAGEYRESLGLFIRERAGLIQALKKLQGADRDEKLEAYYKTWLGRAKAKGVA